MYASISYKKHYPRNSEKRWAGDSPDVISSRSKERASLCQGEESDAFVETFSGMIGTVTSRSWE